MQSITNSRKRILLEPNNILIQPSQELNSPSRLKRRTSVDIGTSRAVRECGRLITVDDNKGERALVLQLSKSFTIGRNDKSDYRTNRLAASQNHCRLHAVSVDTGEIIVCLEDHSTNGTMWNGRRINHQTVVLVDGDVIEIAGQVFRYRHHSAPGVLGSQSQTQESRVVQEKVGNYIVLAPLLGTGAFAVVHLALNTLTFKQVACKKMRRKKMSVNSLASVKREVKILKSLTHPNINRVEDIVISDERVYLFLQLESGGDLFTYLVKNSTIPPPESKFIIFQLFSALAYLHGKDLTHRDIKLENIILEGRGPYPKACLGDFGHSDIAGPDTSIRGTLVYNPPEVLKASSRHVGYDSRPVDCWSLGIVLFMLLFGYHPFDSSLQNYSLDSQDNQIDMRIFGTTAQEDLKDDEGDLKDTRTCWNILEGNWKLPEGRIGSGDIEVRELIVHLLDSNPNKRYTARNALQSRWIVQSEAELLKLYTTIVLKLSV